MRWAPLLIALIFFAAAGLWLALDKKRAQEAYEPGSSFNTGPRGASLARGYLAEHGASVSILERPLALETVPANAVLFRIDPSWREPMFGFAHGAADAGPVDAGLVDAGADDDEDDEDDDDDSPKRADAGVRTVAGRDPFALDDDDDQFVLRGGTLVIAASASEKKQAQVQSVQAEAPAKLLPILPGVRELHAAPRDGLPARATAIDAQTVFALEGAPLIARRILGRGEIWLIGSSGLLENEHLGELDDLALLTALAGRGRAVIFDEVAHGFSLPNSPFEMLRRWGWMPAILFACLAAAMLFWRRVATVGPPADGFRDARTEAIDFVDSAAQLFERALPPADALALYRSHIAREISLRLGVGHAQAEERLRALAPEAFAMEAGAPLSSRELKSQLQILTHALERFRHEHRRSGDG